jgi:hypothetical protein
MNKPHSFTDAKGKCWTACSECDRGGNGKAADKCACGWQVKRFNGAGCYLGADLRSTGEPETGGERK